MNDTQDETEQDWESWARGVCPGDDAHEVNVITLRVRIEIALRNLEAIRSGEMSRGKG